MAKRIKVTKKISGIVTFLGVFMTMGLIYSVQNWDIPLDASNLTSGIIPNARYNMTYLNFTTNITNNIINNFTTINNFSYDYNITNNFTTINNFTQSDNNITWYLNSSNYEYVKFNFPYIEKWRKAESNEYKIEDWLI